MDLLRGGHVGGRDGVVAEADDTQEARIGVVADGDGVDVAVGVGLFGDGDGGEVTGEALAVEAAFEDLGVADGTVGAVGIVHAMEREGGVVEVALGHNAGGIDEALVVRAARDLGAVEMSDGAQRPEVGVDDGVGFREQARGLRRCGFAQEDDDDERGHQTQHQQEGVASALTHR